MLGFRERFVRDWPGEAKRVGEADALFPEGWRAAAVEAAARGSVQPSLIESLPPDERASFDALASERRALAAHLREREDAEARAGQAITPLTTVGVSGVIDHARCPRRFYWTTVRPLPRFS